VSARETERERGREREREGGGGREGAGEIDIYVQDKIISLYNEVYDKNLVTSNEDREAARLAQDLEKKAKLEEKV